MKNILKRINQFRILLIAVLLYAGFALFRPEVFFRALDLTKGFLIEMIQILPPVLVITALITIWVPADVIRRGLGKDSGIKGRLLSLLIGAFSAGPIYAAFPATLALFKKGTSISNVVIILSSWAVIKVPMLLVETSFLGLRFMLLRLLLTIPAILVLGWLTEKLVAREDIDKAALALDSEAKDPKTIQTRLPGLNCGGCGYESCAAFAEAVAGHEKTMEACIVLRNNKEPEGVTV